MANPNFGLARNLTGHTLRRASGAIQLRDSMRNEPETLKRNPEDIVAPGCNDVHVRCHARLQQKFGIRYVDYNVIGHDILNSDRRLTDLLNHALQLSVRERIHLERRDLALMNSSDVGLADVAVHLHLGEILRYQKKRRGLEASGDGLSDINISRDHGAVNRRFDIGVVKIDGGILDRSLLLF